MAIYKSKTPTKDGRQYFFRIKYKDITGKVIDYASQKFLSIKDAELEEAKYRIKIANNEIVSSQVTFKDVYLEYIIHKETQIKKQSLRKIIALYEYIKPIENTKIMEFDLTRYNSFYNCITESTLSVKYKNKILSLLRQLISYSNKYHNTPDTINKYIENFKNPGEIKKELDFFTYDEYKKFDSVIEEHDWHTFFEVLFFLGLRQGECMALTWKDINFDKKEININKTLASRNRQNWSFSSPKTKNSIRVLPIPKKLLNDLKIMYNEALTYKDFKHTWFVFGGTNPFAENTIRKRKNKYCEDAGVKQIRIHDFRHSCCSLLAQNGASIVLVSKYLGHSNITTTLNIYTHLYNSELENLTKMLDNL